VEQLENLLALKRHERPEAGYWQDFLAEFHQRQHEQAGQSRPRRLADRILALLKPRKPKVNTAPLDGQKVPEPAPGERIDP
jgi:hypothetical protein